MTVRNEHPRPQFVRNDWMNLNGEWEFEFDDQRIGLREKWYLGERSFQRRINVPFSFESKLSGINEQEFHDVVWYQRTIVIPENWFDKQVLLHFGAVDYIADVWVNGQHVVTHEGGHTPFEADVTDALRPQGDNVLVVRAEDFSLDLSLPRGKQYWKVQSDDIFYTRTTGIWQTVWMEAVSPVYLQKVQMTPNIDTGELTLRTFLNKNNKQNDLRLKVEISFEGEPVTADIYGLREKEEVRTILLQHFESFRRCMLWSPENPNLYDITFTLLQNDEIVDVVTSYFGMRKISVENGRLLLNNHFYFMRLVLDQGYFPDGNLTPPSDKAMKRDIELAKEMGFNGARKHQKLEDPRWLYWCDRLGFLVWSEAANAYEYSQEYVRRITSEWQASIDRDYNHPCIVAWVPLNESWGVWNIKTNEFQQQHALAMYHLTRSLDQSRLVISNDGWEHMKTDLCTLHDYESSGQVLEQRYRTVESSVNAIKQHNRMTFVGGYSYEGQPLIVSEFGGISFKKSEWEGWGYSEATNEEDFLDRLKAVVQPLLTSPFIQGFCYTQLTDVEQETNGLMTYDRMPKVPLEQIRNIIGAQYEDKTV